LIQLAAAKIEVPSADFREAAKSFTVPRLSLTAGNLNVAPFHIAGNFCARTATADAMLKPARGRSSLR
jgi:hypothetical protein